MDDIQQYLREYQAHLHLKNFINFLATIRLCPIQAAFQAQHITGVRRFATLERENSYYVQRVLEAFSKA